MQMIHPLHAGAVRPIAEPILPVEQRAVRSKTLVRRRQLARSALLLLLSATMLCGMVIWRRDNIRLTAGAASGPTAGARGLAWIQHVGIRDDEGW